MEEGNQENIPNQTPTLEVSKPKVSNTKVYILVGIFILIVFVGIFSFGKIEGEPQVLPQLPVYFHNPPSFVERTFDDSIDKFVYDYETPENILQNHCTEIGGIYNSCGSPCAPNAEVCITVCARTCEIPLNNNGGNTEPVACTDDAKLCPDGSFVVRGPNCEFAECPPFSSKTKEITNSEILFGDPAREFCGAEPPAECGGGKVLGCRQRDKQWGCYLYSEKGNILNEQDISTWKTYRNKEFGFEISYPDSWPAPEEESGNDFNRIKIYPPVEYHEGCCIGVTITIVSKSFDEQIAYYEKEAAFQEDPYLDVLSIKTIKFLNLEGREFLLDEQYGNLNKTTLIPFKNDMYIRFERENADHIAEKTISTFKFTP